MPLRIDRPGLISTLDTPGRRGLTCAAFELVQEVHQEDRHGTVPEATTRGRARPGATGRVRAPLAAPVRPALPVGPLPLQGAAATATASRAAMRSLRADPGHGDDTRGELRLPGCLGNGRRGC